MRFPLYALFASFLPVICASHTQQNIEMVGGYNLITDISEIEEAKSVLHKSMLADKNYRESNMAKVCIRKWGPLYSQVVSGINYKYNVKGCQVDSLEDAVQEGCSCVNLVDFVIQVYFQSWTETYEVNEVTRVINQS
jgi:hypothetical protein